jgi:hypothetical protein
MLTEIALTPHTFQQCTLSPTDWADQLRALNRRLFYYGDQCPLLFSNLNEGAHSPAWRAEVARIIGAARGQYRRLLADLLALIEPYLVVRPSVGQVRVTGDELHWVREAINTPAGFAIDQLVVTLSSLAAAQRLHADSRCINRLEQEVFWNAITLAVFPPMNIQSQVEVLRPLWLHAAVLALVLPYGLERKTPNESPWFFEFAGRALSRPVQHGVPRIELHTSFDGNGNDLITQGTSHPDVADFINRTRAKLAPGQQIDLYVRARSYGSQRFIARRLFAGDFANVGTSTPNVRVRWGVALEHVAIPGDAPNQTPPTFSLLPRQQADSQFRFECRNPDPRLLGPITIRR